MNQLAAVDTEKAFLGNILIDQSILDTTDATPQLFSIVRNRVIFEIMGKLHRSGQAVDNITVENEIEKMGKSKEFGCPAYITELIASGTFSSNSETYVSILTDKYNRRKVLEICSGLASTASDENKNVLDAIPSSINELSNLSIIDDKVVSMKTLASEIYDDIEYKYKNPQDIWGIKTGFPAFDFTTGGLQKGELMIMSGMPKVGKSMWAMQAGLQMGKYNPGGIFSLEMRRMAIARRWVSGISKVDARSLKSGRLQDGDWSRVTDAIGEMEASNLWICDRPRMKIGEYRAQVAKLKNRYNIDWVILDYLYLLDAGSMDDNEKTTMISQELKRICNEFDVAGIVIHSVNKAGMDKISSGADNMHGALRGSAQSEYDCDLAVYLRDYDVTKDKESPYAIPLKDRPNIKELVFGMGRELQDNKKYIRYVKNPALPWFLEYKEPDNGRPVFGGK